MTAVTSLAEVWIEIRVNLRNHSPLLVTSLAEVWIEIDVNIGGTSWKPVTSLAEVWIEIRNLKCFLLRQFRHFPCGSVD